MKRITVIVYFVSLAMVSCAMLVFGDLAKATESTPKPIKIGGCLPLTGIFSESGKWINEGYKFWVEDINKRGGLLGRPVKLIMYDDQSNPHNAVTHYEKAITTDKVDFIFGGYPAPVNVAIMPLVEKYRMVFIGMGGHMKSFEQGFTYSFASPPLMSQWTYFSLAGMLGDLIPKEQWPRSMAMVCMNNVIALGAKPNMIKSAKEHGIEMVLDETYNLPLSDASLLVSKAKAKGAEWLWCLSFFDDGVMIVRSAKAMGYNPKLIFSIIAPSMPAWMKELGEDGNHVISQNWWHPYLPYPGNSDMNEYAKKRFGLPAAPTYLGLGYCWMKTLELAVKGAGTSDQKKVRDYLRSNKFDLPYGKGITFDKRGLPAPFSYVSQTTRGKVELIWPKDVATTKLVYPRPQWK